MWQSAGGLPCPRHVISNEQSSVLRQEARIAAHGPAAPMTEAWMERPGASVQRPSCCEAVPGLVPPPAGGQRQPLVSVVTPVLMGRGSVSTLPIVALGPWRGWELGGARGRSPSPPPGPRASDLRDELILRIAPAPALTWDHYEQ